MSPLHNTKTNRTQLHYWYFNKPLDLKTSGLKDNIPENVTDSPESQSRTKSRKIPTVCVVILRGQYIFLFYDTLTRRKELAV